jgi:hypothetical protein
VAAIITPHLTSLKQLMKLIAAERQATRKLMRSGHFATEIDSIG